MTELTVVIPTYNRAGLLAETLRSLAAQTAPHFAVVVVDHGSTDDTAAVCDTYTRVLSLTTVRLGRERTGLGWVRDAGARRAGSPLLAFLDSGMVAAPGYVDAHLRFHADRGARVGLGYCHGHRPLADGEAAGAEQDERASVTDLDRLRLGWVYGWSGNMSMPAADYHAVGGFDTERECAYEDIDLSYRLHRHGLGFAPVPGGWAVHLPHPRPPIEEVLEANRIGWAYSYGRQRSLGLEAARLAILHSEVHDNAVAEYGALCDAVYRCLCGLGGAGGVPVLDGAAGTGPTVLVGGGAEDAAMFDFVGTGADGGSSTASTWSCLGILLPLADRSVGTVAVASVWQRLGHTFGNARTLLDSLVEEIAR